MTLSGLELRKAACEALGWRIELSANYGDFSKVIKPSGSPDDGYSSEMGAVKYGLPAIESDPAVAIPELRKLCKDNNWGWRIEETDIIRCMIFRRGMITGNRDMVVASERSDSDVAEAVARCIVIASAQEVTK